MSGNLLERLSARSPGNGAHASVESEGDGIDDLGCFGFLRGMRDRAVMLEMRLKTGNIIALPYSWIEFADFSPSDGITLESRGRKVCIKGRNLNAEVRPMIRLFEGIIRHRVPWLRQADRPEIFQKDETATVIESIEW